MTVAGVSGPYAWEPHLFTWGLLAVLVGAVVLGHRRLQAASKDPIGWTRRQIFEFAGAVAASAVALTWPMADLAAHWSLTALVVQRVTVVLVVAPLLLVGLPYDLLQWATRPAWVDALLVRLQRPPVAIVTVTVLLIGSMTSAVVHAQSASGAVRAIVTAAVLAVVLRRGHTRPGQGVALRTATLPEGPPDESDRIRLPGECRPDAETVTWGRTDPYHGAVT